MVGGGRATFLAHKRFVINYELCIKAKLHQSFNLIYFDLKKNDVSLTKNKNYIMQTYVPLEGGRSNIVQTAWALMGLIMLARFV